MTTERTQDQRTAAPPKETERTGRTEQKSGRVRHAGKAAEAVLQGAELRELYPSTLSELAGLLGNSAMLELAAMKSASAELTELLLPGDPPDTVPVAVPEADCDTYGLKGLCDNESRAAPFDPAELTA